MNWSNTEAGLMNSSFCLWSGFAALQSRETPELVERGFFQEVWRNGKWYVVQGIWKDEPYYELAHDDFPCRLARVIHTLVWANGRIT